MKSKLLFINAKLLDESLVGLDLISLFLNKTKRFVEVPTELFHKKGDNN
jgi:hypothetical protein